MLELVILIVLFGLIFDFTNGFHDTANVVSTVIATKALKPLVAISFAVALNTIGATQISRVAHTITSSIINPNITTERVILSALSGAIIWNVFTWYLALPCSSSYSLVGGLIGSGVVHGGLENIYIRSIIILILLPMVISPFVGAITSFSLLKLLQKSSIDAKKRPKLFRYLHIGSSSLLSLSHGFNDAQKSMGIITLGLYSLNFIPTTNIPLWVILSCAITMGIGTASGGMRVIKTVGYKLTKIAPEQGFISDFSASVVIISTSLLGMPISSTNMITGSITGTGLAKKHGVIQWNTWKKLSIAWALTIPGAAIFSIMIYFIFGLIPSSAS